MTQQTKKDKISKRLSFLKVLYWLLLAATIVVFYYSLRHTQSGFIATLVALACWGATYGVHLLIKKLKKSLNETK